MLGRRDPALDMRPSAELAEDMSLVGSSEASIVFSGV